MNRPEDRDRRRTSARVAGDHKPRRGWTVRLPGGLLFSLFLFLPAMAVARDKVPEGGLCLAPFAPERRAGLRISDPAAVRLGREGGAFGLTHSVEFLGKPAPAELRAVLPAYGPEGAGFTARLSGAVSLDPGGTLGLHLYYQGTEILSRIFRKSGGHTFAYPLQLWGGEGYEIALSAAPGTRGRVENLLVEYEGTAGAVPPSYKRYYRQVPLPEEVEARNTLRYQESLNRDLGRMADLLLWGGLYGLGFVFLLLLARAFHRSARRKGADSPAARRKRGAAFALIALCGLLLLPPAGELLYRFGACLARNEPLFMGYPFGFNTENPRHVFYERENTFRFDTEEEGLTVPRLSKGMERNCYGTYFYRAAVNEAGYRGPLKPLPRDAEVVYCIGGSSTYGLNDDGETFPDFVQAALDRYAPGRYTVFNLGIPGLDAAGFAGRVEHLFTIRPDYIVIYAGFNDMALPRSERYSVECAAARRSLLYGPAQWSLALRDLLAGRLARSEEQRALEAEEYHRPVAMDWNTLRLRAGAYAEKIDAVLRYAASAGARVLYVNEYGRIGPDTTLATFRRFSTPEGRADFLRRSTTPLYEHALLTLCLFQARVRRLVEEKGYLHVACVEPACFNGVDPDRVLVDWVHLNARGNRLLGEFTAGKLLEVFGGDSGEAAPAGPEAGKNLLSGLAWEVPEHTLVDHGSEGDTFRSERSRIQAVKTLTRDRLPDKARPLEVTLAVEASRPLVLFSACLETKKTSLPLNGKGVFLGPKVQSFTWTAPQHFWQRHAPLRLVLFFSGVDRTAWVRVREVRLVAR